MKTNWRVELVQWIGIAMLFALAAWAWPRVPDEIPVHWNLHGEADGWGGKTMGLLAVPLVIVGMYLLLLFLPRLDPGYANYQSFAGSYNVLRVTLLAYMAVVQVALVLVALGYPLNMGRVLGISMGLMFIVIGNLLGKIRPNAFVGVRTPWTLFSKLSWTKTHRLAGWLFIVFGLLTILSGLLLNGWMLTAQMAYGAVSLAWIFIYSYLVFRNDPERISPAGTSPQ